ncbi:MAG: DUF4974 domain-containing protein [Eubacterium ramulus]
MEKGEIYFGRTDPGANYAEKLARWYDITVFYQNPALKNKVFKGSVPRYAELQQVLNILEKTGEVQFHIQNRTVIVKE